MAAVYCQLCTSACSAMDRCCDACGRSCSRSCAACGRMCKPINDCVEGIFCSPERPLPICACFTFLIQLAPAVAGAVILATNLSESCSEPLIPLTLFNVVAGFLNMVYAMHLFRAMSEARMDPVAGRKSAFDRACDIFMYDKGVALYIPFAIGQVIMVFVGRNWLSDEAECAGGNIYGFATLSTSLLSAYLGFGLFVIFFSTMAECCRHDAPRLTQRAPPARYDRSHPQHEAARPPPAQRKSLVGALVGGIVGGIFGSSSRRNQPAPGPAAHGNPYNPNMQGGAPPASAPPATNPGYQPPPAGSSMGGGYSKGYDPQVA